MRLSSAQRLRIFIYTKEDMDAYRNGSPIDPRKITQRSLARRADVSQAFISQLVTFPISPTRLLVIGKDIAVDLPVNQLVMRNCRRWIIGTVGTLTQDPKRIEAARTGAPLFDET